MPVIEDESNELSEDLSAERTEAERELNKRAEALLGELPAGFGARSSCCRGRVRSQRSWRLSACPRRSTRRFTSTRQDAKG